MTGHFQTNPAIEPRMQIIFHLFSHLSFKQLAVFVNAIPPTQTIALNQQQVTGRANHSYGLIKFMLTPSVNKQNV